MGSRGGAHGGSGIAVLAMEHMYPLTEVPEVAEINASTGAEVLHAVDFDGENGLRQERQGMLMGTYEKACKPWSETNTPWEFGHQLLEPDIDDHRHWKLALRIFRRLKTESNKLSMGLSPLPLMATPSRTSYRNDKLLDCMWGYAGFSQGGGVGLSLAG